MATCEITTFETHLSPSRNALVDDIQTYLHTDCTSRYHNDKFGFIKMALDMELILPLGQDDVMQNEFGNYAEIIQSDRTWYYFITACEWTSQNAVKVKLSIDSINTFREDLEWSPQTTIEREHLDRLFLGNDKKIYRYIDPEPENIPTTKHITSKTKLLQNNQDINWYLIYDSEQVEGKSTPVRCRCIADQALVISKTGGGASKTLYPADLPSGQYNYVLKDDNPSFSFQVSYTRSIQQGSQEASPTTSIQTASLTEGGEFMVPEYTYGSLAYGVHPLIKVVEKIYRVDNLKFVGDGSNLFIIVNGTYLRDGVTHSGTAVTWTPTFTGYCAISLNGTNISQSIKINELNFTRVTYDGSIPIQYAQQLVIDTQVYNIGTQVTRSTIPFSQVDRTDTKLIKIINLPYAPCNVTYNRSTGVTTFPPEWVYENGFMRLQDNNLNTEFGTTVRSIDLTNTLIDYSDNNIKRRPDDMRRDWRESKMFSSQFSTYKLVYDSFSLEVPMENIYYYDQSSIGKAGVSVPITFDITFKPTNTMNSHFAFYADLDGMISNNPALWDGTNYLHHGDYDEYVVTTRNNEESIFSSAYLDYIRNGYNYDKKVKADQNRQSIGMGAIQALGSALSFLSTPVGGTMSVATGIALGTSALATFTQTAYSNANAENKINQKLKELELQGVNVSGADDVDLLKFYAGNKAYWIRYVTDAHQYYPLLDLFHYCGYKHPRHEVPNVTSRYWFNFIQCAPVFSNEGQFVWQNYLDDIRARYRAGVTVYHRHEGQLTDTAYDWNQTHENWEVTIAQEYEPRYSASWISNLSIDDDGYINCKLTSTKSVLDTDYIQFQYFQNGDTSGTPDIDARYDGPISTGTHTLAVPIGEGQYAWQGSVIRARIVGVTDSRDTTAWVTKVQ